VNRCGKAGNRCTIPTFPHHGYDAFFFSGLLADFSMAEQVYLARLKPAVMNDLPGSIGFLGKAGADSIMARGIHTPHSQAAYIPADQSFCLPRLSACKNATDHTFHNPTFAPP
jgi:hypothetical protein